MQSSDSSTEGGGSRGASGSSAGSTFGSVIGGVQAIFGKHGAGSLRGREQGQAIVAMFRLAQQAAVRDIDASRLALAQTTLSGFAASERPYLDITPGVSADTRKTEAALERFGVTGVLTKVAAHKKAHLERKLAKQQSELPHTYQYAATYGIAGGAPVRGSRDDPQGVIYPNVSHSLLEA
jgi:hypothetical protein